MTIIIEIPQPACRARLVLAHASPCVSTACDVPRDATLEDIARAGFVPLSAFAGPLDLLSPPTLGGALEAIHSVREAVATAYERERDEAIERAEKAEAFAKEIHGRCETLRVERNAAQGRAEKAEAALRMSVTPAHAETIDRAEKAERERDDLLARINDAEHEARTLRAELARIKPDGVDEPLDVELGDMFAQARRDNESGRQRHVVSPLRVVYRLGVAHERARVAAFLLREAADYDADGTITCSGMALRQAVADLGGDAGWQVNGVDDYTEDCQQARQRQQPAKGRATNEELCAIADAVYEEACGGKIANGLHEIALRVAALVRQERCLIAQAVEMGVDCSVVREASGSFRVTVWAASGLARYDDGVPAAEVPATLARLLGEVSAQ